MKMRLKIIALGCWLVVGLVDVWYFVQVPSQVILQGVDITQYALHQEKLSILEIAAGILLVSMSFISKKTDSLFVGLSSALYLGTWFPWPMLRRFGIWVALRSKWTLASNLDWGGNCWLGMWYFIGQVILPCIFLIVIAGAIYSALSNSRPIKEADGVSKG